MRTECTELNCNLLFPYVTKCLRVIRVPRGEALKYQYRSGRPRPKELFYCTIRNSATRCHLAAGSILRDLLR